MKSTVFQHFSNIFSSNGVRNFTSLIDHVPTLIDDNMNRRLVRQVSDSEIWKAVEQLRTLKAPGKDGFPGLFFHKYWNIFGPQVCASLRNFFETGYLPPSINVTSVILIPKISNPENLGQFRPISLCTFIYKIISKIITTQINLL